MPSDYELKKYFGAYNIEMLKTYIPKLYKVKKGQTLLKISRAFFIPASLIVSENRLTGEVEEGMILKIPRIDKNVYTVQCGEKKETFYKTTDEYERQNKTSLCYPGQDILLP